MGKGIISNKRLCVRYTKFKSDDLYTRQFILFNTADYFTADICICVIIDNTPYYTPALSLSSSKNIPDDSIVFKFNNLYVFPNVDRMFSSKLYLNVNVHQGSSIGLYHTMYLTLGFGGNTIGLNYKISWKETATTAYTSQYFGDFEWSITNSGIVKTCSIYDHSSIPVKDVAVEITCECANSTEVANFTINGYYDYQSEFEFSLLE